MAITKEQLLKDVAEATATSESVTELIVNEFMGQLAHRLKHNNKIKLKGFGEFYTRFYPARLGYTPDENAPRELIIPARMEVHFKGATMLNGGIVMKPTKKGTKVHSNDPLPYKEL